jgi:hypothetical protein
MIANFNRDSEIRGTSEPCPAGKYPIDGKKGSSLHRGPRIVNHHDFDGIASDDSGSGESSAGNRRNRSVRRPSNFSSRKQARSTESNDQGGDSHAPGDESFHDLLASEKGRSWAAD